MGNCIDSFETAIETKIIVTDNDIKEIEQTINDLKVKLYGNGKYRIVWIKAS